MFALDPDANKHHPPDIVGVSFLIWVGRRRVVNRRRSANSRSVSLLLAHIEVCQCSESNGDSVAGTELSGGFGCFRDRPFPRALKPSPACPPARTPLLLTLMQQFPVEICLQINILCFVREF
jgi:hypothetical protein